jgi:hypothetical protein
MIATGAAALGRMSGRPRMLVQRRPLGATIADMARAAARYLFDPYRPELHYMRGPGPKWRERHARRQRGA